MPFDGATFVETQSEATPKTSLWRRLFRKHTLTYGGKKIALSLRQRRALDRWCEMLVQYQDRQCRHTPNCLGPDGTVLYCALGLLFNKVPDGRTMYRCKFAEFRGGVMMRNDGRGYEPHTFPEIASFIRSHYN